MTTTARTYADRVLAIVDSAAYQDAWGAVFYAETSPAPAGAIGALSALNARVDAIYAEAGDLADEAARIVDSTPR